MSYVEKKTLGVKYIDHRFKLYINGVPHSNDVRLKDGTRVYVEPVEEEKIKDIDVNVKVNTTPFDDSVDRCGDHIGALTGSIIGFKAANVASKIENEKQIVNSVTSGFTSLIEQNLTLQNASIEAEMHALAGELMQQCKELEYKHEVMNKDFNRIKSRYTSLFDTISKEMDNRIKLLIKPCFDFVAQLQKEQNRRIETNLLSMATTGGKESDTARIAIQASKIKHNAEMLIDSAGKFIVENKSTDKVRQAFVVDGNRDDTFYSPVIILYGQDESSCQETKLFFNPLLEGKADVENSLKGRVNKLKERDMGSNQKAYIGNYFDYKLTELSSKSGQDQRVVALAKQLYTNNLIKTFAI